MVPAQKYTVCSTGTFERCEKLFLLKDFGIALKCKTLGEILRSRLWIQIN